MELQNTLRLERFCGREVYGVEAAEVFLNLPDEDEEGIVLNLEFRCGKAIETTTPEAERDADLQPIIEVNVPIPSLAADELVGTTIRIQKSQNEERGTWNRIYTFEHVDLRNISVSFVELSENTCRVSLTGRTQDPNYYDGSKPETIVKLQSWFSVAKLTEAAADFAKKAATQKPAPEKPATQKPPAEAPVSQRPVAEKPADQAPPSERPATQKSAPEKPAVKKPAAEAPAAKKPALKQQAAKKPAPEKAAPKKPAPEKAAPKKAAPKKAAPKKPAPKKAAPKKKPAPTKPSARQQPRTKKAATKKKPARKG